MGISSLLPTLKSVSRPCHVGDAYGGKTVCVDGYVWLHRGAYACSRELCEGERTRKHVEYFINRARTLRRANVRAIFVFDGGRMPGKAGEEETRRRTRTEALAKARQHARRGNASAANECYARAVDVTPEMARDVVEALKKEGFESLTAPYEADAQMAYLARNGFVQGVVTEDSDLIAHGCASVFTKMQPDGTGIEIRYEDLGKNRGMSFVGFTSEMFLEMCILSGCDYLPSLAGVGIKKAHSLIRRFKTHAKVLRHMKFEGISVPKEYEARFQDALLTFRYSWVFCPRRRENVHLNDPIGVLDESVIADLPRLIGEYHPPDVARGIANSAIHPMTLESFAGCLGAPRRDNRLLAALAPAVAPPEMDAHDRHINSHIDNQSLPRRSPRKSASPMKKHEAFTSFLQSKPEDDAQGYRMRIAQTRTSPRAAPAPRVAKSFYATLKSTKPKTPPEKQRRRESIDLFDVSREDDAKRAPTVVPDSVEKATPRRSPRRASRLPRDISNFEPSLVAETPLMPTTVKKSPYFASVSSPQTRSATRASYAHVAKSAIDRAKRNAEAEFGAFEHKRAPIQTPARSTPARAAKKPRVVPSTASGSKKSKSKPKTKDDKFWQTSLFDTFAFHGKK